jgi:hypothetical protein
MMVSGSKSGYAKAYYPYDRQWLKTFPVVAGRTVGYAKEIFSKGSAGKFAMMLSIGHQEILVSEIHLQGLGLRNVVISRQ